MDTHQTDCEIERHLFGSAPRWHAPRPYSRDTYAQAVLVNHLERLGFAHAFAPPLEFEPQSGAQVRSSCSRVECSRTGRAFVCYAGSDGEALVGAALLALRAGAWGQSHQVAVFAES
jgi:hypothetical protein